MKTNWGDGVKKSTILLLTGIFIMPTQNFLLNSNHQELFNSGVNAYLYAYPLVIMEITKQLMTGFHQSKSPGKINQFTHISAFPTDTFKDIVRPNVDTLYSFAWLDLSTGPLVLSVPNTHERYYLMELLDGWTNVFASIGKRTTGTQAKKFVIVGPQWKGQLPHDMMPVHSPTSMVLILGRTQTNGKKDYDAVRAIQAGYTLQPLCAQKQSGVQPHRAITALSGAMAPVDVIAAMNANTFYTIFAQTLKNNPAAKNDYALLAQLKTIGIEPGKDFNKQAANMKILNQAMEEAKKRIREKQTSIPRINGWGIMRNLGNYGTDYLTRAMIANMGIGANLPEDALYPAAFVDANDKPLKGNQAYTIHFDKHTLPPVNAFWSITLYDAQGFLAKNLMHRYALGDRDHLAFNQDGSLDIYVQHASPGKSKESNWLPAPAGDFNLVMRLYWPKQSVLNGSWNPSPIEPN